MPETPSLRSPVDRLVELISLQSSAPDCFIGQSEDIGTPSVFGGQVLAQALLAAGRTAPTDRSIHSLHAYFLLPGVHAPINYSVDRVRDGRSFTTRRVVATQNGESIFELLASFQSPESGVEHQPSMPDVPEPEALRSEHDYRLSIADRFPAHIREKALLPRGIEFRHVNPIDLLNARPRPATMASWVRVSAPLPDDPILHRALMAYASDHALLLAATMPHGLSLLRGDVRLASLDHAMWFHHDFRMDEWLLYQIESPCTSGARGLCRGQFFDRTGRLVASTTQEGVVRDQRHALVPPSSKDGHGGTGSQPR
jgi:acyl-CoA thioesterase II